MAKLGTLEIVGNVSVCSKSIRTIHQFVGATVEVTIVGTSTVVASGVAQWANQAFPITTTPGPNTQLIAVQKNLPPYDDGGPSAKKPVADKPTPQKLSEGGFLKPLYRCARCIWLYGLLPGATVEVFSQAESLGTAEVNEYGGANVSLNRALKVSDWLIALQTACGNIKTPANTPIVGGAPQQLPASLPAPTLDPLYVCGQALYVKNVTPGAQVTLSRNGWVRTFCAPVPQFPIYPLDKLEVQESVTASQAFDCGGHSRPLGSGTSSTPVLDKKLDPPVLAPLCGGDEVVGIKGLQAGATVELTIDGDTVVFGAPAPYVNYPVAPLKDNSTVTARQNLCGLSSTWSPASSVTVVPSQPVPPALVSPPDKAPKVPVTPTLAWKDGPGTTSCNHPTSFDLQIGQDDSLQADTFAKPKLVKDIQFIDVHQYTVKPPSLATGKLHWWRVRGHKGAKVSDWSTPWSFTPVEGTPQPTMPPPVEPKQVWCFIQDCCPVYQRKVVCTPTEMTYYDALGYLKGKIKDAPSCWIYEPNVKANANVGTCSDPKWPPP